jgi:choline-sulfatase
VLILTSDHGERLGEVDRWAHCQSLHAYELNVPLMVYRSDVEAASRIEAAVTTLDVYPTVLAATGISYEPTKLDGRDLFSVDADRTVYSVWEREHAIQDARFKLVTDLRGGAARSALYDLSADPAEQEDVLRDNPARAAELHRVMAEYTDADDDVLRRIDETLEHLKAIGYVE